MEVTLETSRWWMERTWVEIWGLKHSICLGIAGLFALCCPECTALSFSKTKGPIHTHDNIHLMCGDAGCTIISFRQMCQIIKLYNIVFYYKIMWWASCCNLTHYHILTDNLFWSNNALCFWSKHLGSQCRITVPSSGSTMRCIPYCQQGELTSCCSKYKNEGPSVDNRT